ncbi:MAG: T9SS C-terminal target domain-containing protein [Flavobacteriales bacterium TMED84]|nr:MAG: T9SS C-terminal target domain-containing protein [Flavobacteriales bacterium TMED84]
MKKIFTLSLIFTTIASYSQTFVSTTPENKNVVLEEFTGISCTYCPDGHRIANDIYNNNPTDVVLINIHTGGYASPQGPGTDFNTMFGSAIAAQSNLSGYPAGTVNRRVFAGLGQNGGTAMSRGNWQSASSQILNEPSYVNVAAQANLDISTRQLSVTVEAYYTGSSPVNTNKLNVALIQNNVEGPQTGASYNPTAILPNGNYNHQHMLRHMLTGQWGDDITNTSTGSFFTNTYTYTIPNDLNGVAFDLFNLEVAVFLTETQQNVVTGNMAYMNLVVPPGINLVDLVASSNMSIPSSYCDNNLTPEITVTNNTSVPVDTFAVSYTLNNNAPVTQNVYSSLQPGSTTTISFNSITVPSGTNNISYAVTTIANTSFIDNVPSNNVASSGSFNTLSPTAFATNHSEGFEGFALATPAPNNAILENPQDNWVGIIDDTYTQGQPVGGYGNSVNSYRFRLNSFSAGQSAKLIWEKLDFSDAGNYQIKYDLAHALKNSWDGDVIQIIASTDCGLTWNTVSQMSGSSTATYGTISSSGNFNPLTIGGTTNYYPSNNTSSLQHWRTDSVDLSAYNGNPDVMLAINVICGGGNNLYLDNIIIEAISSSTSTNLIKKSINLYPNPANNFIVIDDFDNVTNYEIFDSMGKKVAIIESGKTDINFLESGIYFVKSNGNTLKRFSVVK